MHFLIFGNKLSLFSLSFLGAHEEAAAPETGAQAGHVAFNHQLVLVPLVIHRQLLALHDASLSEKPDGVQSLTFVTPAQVEGLHVWVTTVVDEPGFVAVEHRVKAQREELVVVC